MSEPRENLISGLIARLQCKSLESQYLRARKSDHQQLYPQAVLKSGSNGSPPQGRKP